MLVAEPRQWLGPSFSFNGQKKTKQKKRPAVQRDVENLHFTKGPRILQQRELGENQKSLP